MMDLHQLRFITPLLPMSLEKDPACLERRGLLEEDEPNQSSISKEGGSSHWVGNQQSCQDIYQLLVWDLQQAIQPLWATIFSSVKFR